MASGDAVPVPRKNVAFRVTFPILDADGDLVTGATGLDSEVSIDGGTFADATSEATEIATASGMYFLDLTAGEMNGDTVAVIVKTSTSGAKTTVLVMYPESIGDVRVNVSQVGGTTQTAGDLAALITTVDDFVDTEVANIQSRLPAALVGGRMDSSVGAVASGVIAAASFAANALDAVWSTTVRTITGIGSGGISASSYASGAIDATAFAQGAADKVWSSATRTLSAAGVQAIWDALTSALTTVGSIGKRIVDNLDATVSSRSVLTGTNVENSVWEAVASSHTTALTMGLKLNNAAAAGDPLSAAVPGAYSPGTAGYVLGNMPGSVWDVVMSSHTTGGSVGAKLNSLSGAAGAGSTVVPFTTSPAVDGVEVWVSVTNDPNASRVAQCTTGSAGTCSVNLDPGSYYWFAAEGGYARAMGGFTV